MTVTVIVELYHNTSIIKIPGVQKHEMSFQYTHAAMKINVSDKATTYE